MYRNHESRVFSIHENQNGSLTDINQVMERAAKLIHKTDMTYLPTAFPAHFYGMPDGKVYIVYSRFYEVKFGETGVEFVFAEHKEFSYDYLYEKIIPCNSTNNKTAIFAETLDKPNPKITPSKPMK